MNTFSIINPYSNKIIETHPYESIQAIEQKITTLKTGFNEWANLKTTSKKTILAQLSASLKKENHTLAELISTDMGKPITEAKNEVKKCIECCLYYEKNITSIKKKLSHPNGIREPLGIILGIMPWNYPLWQIIRYLIPNLAVGNTCLIKPAYNTYRIAQQLNACATPIDIPLFDICIPEDRHIKELIGHPKIAGVSFTGSVQAGKQVGQLATSHLKPCTLELGGSDPFIVFKDANLATAINHAISARFTNAGQVCISAKRFLFHQSIYQNALDRFKSKAADHLCFGDPTNPKTTIGPLARIDIKNKLSQQLSNANISPQHIIFEQSIDQPRGNAVPGMIIDGHTLTPNNPLFTDEVFGPIAICDSFETTEEAIEKANATPYGLGASIWTKSTAIISECTQKIDCGTLAINTPVHSRFDTPFGGRKQSGLGLELGIEGALSFTGFKAIMKAPEKSAC